MLYKLKCFYLNQMLFICITFQISYISYHIIYNIYLTQIQLCRFYNVVIVIPLFHKSIIKRITALCMLSVQLLYVFSIDLCCQSIPPSCAGKSRFSHHEPSEPQTHVSLISQQTATRSIEGLEKTPVIRIRGSNPSASVKLALRLAN